MRTALKTGKTVKNLSVKTAKIRTDWGIAYLTFQEDVGFSVHQKTLR